MLSQKIFLQQKTIDITKESNEFSLDENHIEITRLICKSTTLGKLLIENTNTEKINFQKNEKKTTIKQFNLLKEKIVHYTYKEIPRLKELTLQNNQKSSRGNLEKKFKQTNKIEKSVISLGKAISEILVDFEKIKNRILEEIPNEDKIKVEEIFEAFDIYDKALINSAKLEQEEKENSILFEEIKNTLSKYLEQDIKEEHKSYYNEIVYSIKNLIENNHSIIQKFTSTDFNGKNGEIFYNSVKTKFSDVQQKIMQSDLDHSKVILAIAKQHDISEKINGARNSLKINMQELERLVNESNKKSNEINIEAIELIKEKINNEPIKNQDEIKKQTIERPVELTIQKTDTDSKITTKINNQSFINKIKLDLLKTSEWLIGDIKKLQHSTYEDKIKVGTILSEEINQIEQEISNKTWPLEEKEIQKYSEGIISKFEKIQKMIDEAMDQISPPPSPKIKAVSTPVSTPIAVQTPIQTKYINKTQLFENKIDEINLKIDIFNKEIFAAHEKQAQLHQIVSENNLHAHIIQKHVIDADSFLISMTNNFLAQYSFNITNNDEVLLSAKEIIPFIQSQKSHPLFNLNNCLDYLHFTSIWIDSFSHSRINLKNHQENIQALLRKTISIPASTQKPAMEKSIGKAQFFENKLDEVNQKIYKTNQEILKAYANQAKYHRIVSEKNLYLHTTLTSTHHTDRLLMEIIFEFHEPYPLYINPYHETNLSAKDMISLIQKQKSHPHFNLINCIDYLKLTSSWLDTLSEKLTYIKMTQSNTQSLLKIKYN